MRSFQTVASGRESRSQASLTVNEEVLKNAVRNFSARPPCTGSKGEATMTLINRNNLRTAINYTVALAQARAEIVM